MKTNVLFKNFFISAIVSTASLSVFAQATKQDCGQNFRQLSLTSAHAIAAMACNLQSNNLTEKLSRLEGNSLNFINKWTVAIDDSSFVIDATCSTSIRYYDRLASKPVIVHPGYRLQMVLPRFEATCDPTFSGTMTEIYNSKVDENSSMIEKAQDATAKYYVERNVRSVNVSFKDSGFRDSANGEYKGGRTLSNINLGSGLFSMIRSGFSNASMNEGTQTSEENKMAIGENSLAFDFFKTEKDTKSQLLLAPNFSLIKSGFQFNKATDPSLANRDILTISGFDRDLYIRQSGVTQIDDPRLDYSYVGGTTALFVRDYNTRTQIAEVAGCTDYSYAGDYNTAGTMTTNDCRMLLMRLPGY